jgi:hypothetical protein
MRILCLGIGSEKSTKYDHSNLELPERQQYPTISDYDLVIMDLANLYSWSHSRFAETRKEFQKFFENKGVCFVISTKYDKEKGSGSSNFDWCPFAGKITIESTSGETVICKYGRAKFIFDSINFWWDCFFSAIRLEHTILAANRTNDPISVMIPYENGFCIFLPCADEENTNKLLGLLIEKGLNLIPEIEKITSSNIPSWASSTMSKAELELLKSIEQINEKLGKYNRFKPLFWETGENLKDLVIDAFEEFGIRVTKLSKESHADFEISISQDLIAVCEVKGLLGNANREDLRQLLDYFIEQRDIEKRNVKGVFIVNHYRNQELKGRGAPATKDAMELIQKYSFSLLTTIQLYEYLTKFWRNELKKGDILRILQHS